ncbi:MAG: DUF2309 domain-containing protein [Bryobacteraceae bacterium]
MEHPNSAAERLEHTLDHLAHLLPAQGPIGVFVHHNTLHAFQHMPFDEAVVEAGKLFHAEPYMREEAYREAFRSGRIRAEDIAAVMDGSEEEQALRRPMLIPGVRDFHPETVAWEISEGGLAERFRGDLQDRARAALQGESPRKLFDFWRENTPAPVVEPTGPARPRDGVFAATGIDIDDAVHPLLIRLAGSFLDQGLAYWPMPNREAGFWRAATRVLHQRGGVPETALRHLHPWLDRWAGFESNAAVLAILEFLGVDEAEWEHVLRAELLAMPGWPGLIAQIEHDPSLSPHEQVPARLVDFVAVRMLLTAAATVNALADGRAWKQFQPPVPDAESRRLAAAAHLFDVSQLTGLTVRELSQWKPARLETFRRAVEAFDHIARRRTWHAAYERRHERQILLPLQQHSATPPSPSTPRLAAQVFFCIDEREESIRRHLEEIDPEMETFGAAGFFGVAMNYTGMDDAHGAALCPVVVKPQHAIEERPAAGHEDSHGRRRVLRRGWALAARHSFISSRTLMRGWIGTTALGLLSFLPLAARVLTPRRYARLMNWLNESVLPEPRTELTFMRAGEASHDAAEGLVQGFTVPEKVDRVASVLGPAGLRRGMARIVVVLGHGSTSLNNPHESAHDCGACGGRRGGPNARIFAVMANYPEVRKGLRERDIHIPDDTWFVGGYHDTCNDNVDLYDLDQVPESHRGDLTRVRASLDAARAASALERARRFEAASSSRNSIDGLHHVQERAEHLAEPRPEYGHCTNAVCLVGRRANSRGLFLDRRAFLVSYDPNQDPTGSNLAALLGAVIPVCGGISLEYYFSFVDNERYGCGTKLPHNVTGLMGVMNGYESDLRTGLPWQMVEIHEPVRILFVLETTPERVLEIVRRSPLLSEFLFNGWIRLAVADPADGRKILAYRGGEVWEPVEGSDETLPQAPTSLDWYHGKREHLPIARIAARSAA